MHDCYRTSIEGETKDALHTTGRLREPFLHMADGQYLRIVLRCLIVQYENLCDSYTVYFL